jgi:hypothetical protein
MRSHLVLVLALVTALAAQDPQVSLTLEVRAFNGTEDVTAQSRFTVHRAGERQTSVTPAPIRMGDGQPALQVPSGVYDVQAIHERDGKVVNIRWANRLVVMPYPDEKGHHLEVVNFKNGFGALQVRGTGPEEGRVPTAALYVPGNRAKPVVPPHSGRGYALFVVPAGTYDLQVRIGDVVTWMTGLEVPIERTRLIIVPKTEEPGKTGSGGAR